MQYISSVTFYTVTPDMLLHGFCYTTSENALTNSNASVCATLLTTYFITRLFVTGVRMHAPIFIPTHNGYIDS